MTDSHRPEDWASLGAAWREEVVTTTSFEAVDVNKVRARASRFARRITRRNLSEFAASVLVAGAGLHMAWVETRPLLVAAGVSMVLAAVVVAAVLARRGGTRAAPPPEAPLREVLSYERGELERQASLLESVWRWYLAPLLVSIVLVYTDKLLVAIHRDEPSEMLTVAAAFAGTVLFFVLVGHFNARTARRLRARAHAVLREDSSAQGTGADAQ